jgi:hypothetical protein
LKIYKQRAPEYLPEYKKSRMDRSRQKSDVIGQFILDNVSLHPDNIVKITAQRFAMSRQAAARHIKKLVVQGDIEAEGNTSGRVYRPSQGHIVELSYSIADHPVGASIWKMDILPVLQTLPGNIIDLWDYCFQRIFKNGCDHSGGTTVHVQVVQQKNQTIINIADDGEGLFKNIQANLGLKDEQEAALWLSNEQLPIVPENSAKKNIFFSSRMADFFTIVSGKIIFTHQNGIAWDWALGISPEKKTGTVVSMMIENDTPRTVAEVLHSRTTSPTQKNAASKVCIPVRLAKYGAEALFSRSQARRILARIDRFNCAVLDFIGVKTIGAAFADQIFRVFPSEYPGIQLLHCNANKQVEAVIREAKANSAKTARNKR